jgi:site-specific recombinase XerD
MSINVNGKRLFINLPSKFKALEFNRKRKPQEITDVIEQFRTKVNESVADLLSEGQPITSYTLRDRLKSGGIKSRTIKDLFDEYIEHQKPRLGHSLTEQALNKYTLAGAFIYNILTQDREITSIKPADMELVYNLLKAQYKESSAGGFMTRIRTVFNYAFVNGYIRSNPTAELKISKGQPIKEFLTLEELNRIEALELNNERLERARDLFLFQAYGGGMAYCDMAAFNPRLMKEVDGTYIYSNVRQKTKQPFTTVIMPKALEILAKYNYTLPNLRNQVQNRYLKEIQIAAHIDKELHTHIARKSYATLLMNKDVPISTITKCMGHSNSAITTRVYAFTQEETIARQVGSIKIS